MSRTWSNVSKTPEINTLAMFHEFITNYLLFLVADKASVDRRISTLCYCTVTLYE